MNVMKGVYLGNMNECHVYLGNMNECHERSISCISWEQYRMSAINISVRET